MKKLKNNQLLLGSVLLLSFTAWTALITFVDVMPVGPKKTSVGFAALNTWFHDLTGVHMSVYMITDWLGLVPVVVCLYFAVVGIKQWIKRRNLFKIDADVLLLGAYYILVITAYIYFEMVPINYRPILINGHLEASYPSSTTLLVLSVMPTLKYQIDRRVANASVKTLTNAFITLFSFFMVIGRLIAGVHWFTDIVGGILLSTGLFCLYICTVQLTEKKNRRIEWNSVKNFKN